MGLVLSANTSQYISDLILPSGTTFPSGVTELLSPDGPFTLEDIRDSLVLQSKIDSGLILLTFNSKTVFNVSSIGIDSFRTFNISGGTVVNNQEIYRVDNNQQTDINSSTNWTPITFKNTPTINTNSDIFEGVVSGVLIKKDLRCKITSNVFYTSTSNRVNNPISISLNGVVQSVEGASGYIRNNNGHNDASVHVSDVFNLTAGTVVTIVGRREGNSGVVTHVGGKSNLVVECFDGVSGGTFFPKPIITEVLDGIISTGNTSVVTLNGGYITPTTTVVVPSSSVTNINIIDDDSLTFEITPTTLGLFDIIVSSEGGDTTVVNGIEVINNTWINLSTNGPTFTDGNGAGNNIRYRTGMSMVRDSIGMGFVGSSPWSSWVKFESLGWNRGDNKTIEWVLTPPTSAMMIGIGSDATDETSTAQYQQGEVQAYFSSTTNFWGLYGNNGSVGFAGSQASSASISGLPAIKVTFESDGGVGGQFTLYGLSSTSISAWNEVNNVLKTFVVNNTLNPNQSNLFPFIIPVSGVQRILAVRII